MARGDGDVAAANQPTPGEWAIIAGGAVALIGSFLEFAIDESAWGSGFFPIVTLIPIYLIVIAIQVAVARFGSTNLPGRVAGFTWLQLHLVLAFFAALMVLFWVIAAENRGIGMWLLLLGAAASLVGAFLEQRETTAGTTGTPGTTGPTGPIG
jgi:hypothetical protein